MGHDHIRFVLMVAFFFSTCLIASFGSEMEIIRFSGTYMLTHSERVVQVTESITGSERVEKVAKVASLAPNEGRRRRSKSRRRRTTQEFQMRQKSNSCEGEEKKEKTFIPTATSAMTLGTTTDQQDLCWSRAHSHHRHDSSIGGGQCSNNHESAQEFTATYPDSGSTSSFLVCQKLSFLQQNLSEWSIEGKGRSEDVVVEEKEERQQQDRHERKNTLLNDDSPYKPIFFVYPPQRRPSRFGRKKKVGNDDGMDYYQPTFHLDLDFESGSSSKDTDSIFSEYDPRIRGGFDSYGEDVSFYFSGKTSSGGAGLRNKNEEVRNTGKEKGNSLANASSYFDELCKALLLDYG